MAHASVAKWQCSQVTGKALPRGWKKGLLRSIGPVTIVLNTPVAFGDEMVWFGPWPIAADVRSPAVAKVPAARPRRRRRCLEIETGSIRMLNAPLRNGCEVHVRWNVEEPCEERWR